MVKKIYKYEELVKIQEGTDDLKCECPNCGKHDYWLVIREYGNCLECRYKDHKKEK